MCQFFKLILMSQFIVCLCTIYYDDENTVDEMIDENEKDDDQFQMLIHGGYHVEDPLFDKYVVSLRTRRPSEFFGDNHYCAGTVVGTRMVLTAAHCVMDARRIKMRVRAVIVVAGTPNRLYHNPHTKELEVEKIFVHPEFKRNGIHDIAIIMLLTEIPLGNKAIRIMSLANERPKPNTTCITAGWGQLYNHGPYASKIVYLLMDILPHEDCEKAYGHQYNRVWNLCAGDPASLALSVCYGDSGGPLVCASRLAGIVSWGIDCGTENKPVVFTDVHSHYKWLVDVKNCANQRKFSLLTAIVAFLLASVKVLL